MVRILEIDSDFKKLYEEADKLSNKIELSEVFKYKQIGCALMTDKNNIYTGVSVKAPSGMGNCAEYSAIVEMLKNDEYNIKKIVSVRNGVIVSPCGRCRELLRQITTENFKTKVLVNENTVATIKELLPFSWNYQDGK